MIEFAWLDDRSAGTKVASEGVGLSSSFDGRTILGWFKLLPGKFKLLTQSSLSAERAKAKLIDVLVGVANYRTRGKHDMAKMRANAARKKPLESTLIPEDQARMLQRMLLSHYRSWLDIPVPALAGLTPRDVYRRPDRRSDVEALIRGLESGPFAVPASALAMLGAELGKD